MEILCKHLSGPAPRSKAWRATLVLVHGIDGDITETWASREGNGHWYLQRQGLRNDVAIIALGLGYRHRVIRSIKETLIEDYAASMLQALRQQRLFDRPIFFLCHSLGGILIKRTICDIFNYDPDRYFERRANNLNGLFFLGVPHHGSPWAESTVAFLSRPLRSETSKDLKSQSRLLRDAQNRFPESLKRFGDVVVVSAFETQPPPPSDLPVSAAWKWSKYAERLGPVCPKPSAVIGLKGERLIEAKADHGAIARFSYDGAEADLRQIFGCVNDCLNGDPDSEWERSILQT